MANAVKKITLSSSRDIPFNKLVLSQSNVRRVKAGVSIESLAESIARRGLIQSLHVRPVIDADGAETGMFEVPAGGRRFRALEMLVKQKRLAKGALVPCVVGEAGSSVLMEEISFAENDERVSQHPLDQYRAFQSMREKGMTEESIAAAFMIDVNVVKQRLRLASISPVLLDLYAEDGIDLRQLMAFTVTEDHDRQEQVWAAIKDGWQREPWQIRRMLTETAVRATDKRAVFVGVDPYVEAGGIVLRDLFQSDEGGWLQDPALLDRLVAKKLKTIADEIAAEGWKWVEAAVSIPFDATYGMRGLAGTRAELTSDEQAARHAFQAEFDQLQQKYDSADELPDEVDARLGELETALATFDLRPVRFDPAEIAIAGALVSINSDGTLSVDRGHVRPEDDHAADHEGDEVESLERVGVCEPSASSDIQHPTTEAGENETAPADDDDTTIKPLPERVVVELTAHRTLALRDAVAAHPHVAMTALLHKLVSDAFQHGAQTGALDAYVRHIYFPAQAENLKDSLSAKSVADRHERWADHAPADDGALWDWLEGLDDGQRMDLLAHCVSYGVNALFERPNPYGGSGVSDYGLRVRMSQADRLARATALDMVAAGWRPTVGNYLGRVTKARIIEAVSQGVGERAAQQIGHMKKDDMAQEAERLLAESGWLPEPLRMKDVAASSAGLVDEDACDPSPQSDLADDRRHDEPAESDEDEEAAMLAAE